MRFRGVPPIPVARVKCDDCGEVNLEFPEITVRVCVDTHEAEYRFRCPHCLKVCIEPVVVDGLYQQLIVRTMKGRYAHPMRLECWWLPSELFERPAGPPLTNVDLVLFQRQLAEL